MAIDEHETTTSADADSIAQMQRTRLRRVGMSAISYALQILLVSIIGFLGGLSLAAVVLYSLSLLAIVGFFYGVFKAGWNLRARHPNLTLVQVLAPALPGVIVLYWTRSEDAQAALLLTMVVPLLYGTMDLDAFGFRLAAFVYSAGFLAVLIGKGLLVHASSLAMGNEMLVASLMIVMPQVIWLSATVNRLRRRLHDRNQQYREAMTRLSAIAERDDLTGVYNRRRLGEVMEREQQRCGRPPYGFCIALIDLDHFKGVNDRYGHAVGDEVLKTVARHIAEQIRAVDSFGRFGGEEFLWIMPSCDRQGALTAAERLRNSVAALTFDGGRSRPHFSITLSVGIADHDSELALSKDALLKRADNALYRAKETGRNRVVLADPMDVLKRGDN